MRYLWALLFVLSAACDQTAGGWDRPVPAVPTPEGLLDASDPQAITEIVARRDTGFWRRDGFRDPVIEVETAGEPWQIEFYGCEDGKACTDLRFVAQIPPRAEGTAPDPTDIADWNRETRFGKATLTDEGVAVLELNLAMAGGVTRQNFDLTLDWWLVALSSFTHNFKG
ncbi:MAG: YbjN domain-containing protein [Pseudomonadota bacterium]